MRRRRLYARIYLHFVGVLLVVGVLSSLMAAAGWRWSFLRAQTLRLAHHAAVEVALQPDAAARLATMRHISDELDLELTLRAPDGRRLLAQVGGEIAPLDADDAEDARRHTVLLRHGRTWVAASPVRDRSGGVEAVLAVAPKHRLSAISLLRPITMVALTLLVVGAATFPLARRISRPVERLTEASRRLGAGELSYRVPLDGAGCDAPGHRRRGRHRHRHHHPDDELTHLTRAWNEMAERVEGLVRGQRELLANVSHELRSPLARIRVALELLPGDAGTRARIDDVKADLGELERLIDDVLTTARLDATGLPMHLDEVALAPLLQQLAERAQHDPLTAGKPVRVADRDGPDVGVLAADGALLKRALWNLVENAAKYGAPPIVLGAVRGPDTVTLSVSDEGPGVPPEQRARVFDPFYRVDKARTPHGGAGAEVRAGFGLGLTLARRVAEVHGGRIALGDGPGGRGCVVSITLPLERRGA